MASNIEEFLIELKLVDKGTLQKVKKFYKDFDKMGEKTHKTQKKRQSELEKFQDAVSKEKLKDVKREQLAKEKAHREDLKRVQEIERARRRMLRSEAFQTVKGQDIGRAAEFQKRFKGLASERDIEGIRDLNSELSRTSREIKSLRRQQLGLTSVQRGLTDSTRNMVRAYASMFALFEGTQAINRVGQDFEAMEAGMQVTADSSKEVAKNLAFVDKQAVRLGLNLVDTSKSFTRIAAAAKGKIAGDDIKTIFTGIAEAGTVMQLPMDDMNGALRAVQQMISKGQIFAEEFRQQLLERLPMAMRAMEIATGKTSGEISKMMEQGQLGLDVLPKFGMALSEMARDNGALGEAIATVRVQQSRFITASQKGARTIFKGGFGEGIAQMFNDLTEGFENSEEGLKGLGSIFEAFFDLVKRFANVIIPPLNTLFGLVGKIAELFSFLFDNKLGEFIIKIGLMTGAVWKLTSAMDALNVTVSTLFKRLSAIFIIFEELFALFDAKKTGVFEKGMFGGKQIQNLGISDFLGTLPVIGNAVKDTSGDTISGVPIQIFVDGVETSVEQSADGRTARATVQGSY